MGCIYFVRAVGIDMVKIGFTDGHPKMRMGDLQVGSPIRLESVGFIEGTTDDEQAIHRTFAEHRSHGEWFHMSPPVLAFIEDSLANGTMSSTYDMRPTTRQNLSIRLSEDEKATVDEYRNQFNPPLDRSAALRQMIADFDLETMAFPDRHPYRKDQ